MCLLLKMLCQKEQARKLNIYFTVFGNMQAAQASNPALINVQLGHLDSQTFAKAPPVQLDKQMIGERLYRLVYSCQPKLAVKEKRTQIECLCFVVEFPNILPT